MRCFRSRGMSIFVRIIEGDGQLEFVVVGNDYADAIQINFTLIGLTQLDVCQGDRLNPQDNLQPLFG